MLLSVLATAGLAVMWLIFWVAVIKQKESVSDVLLSQSFFRVVAVMGVVAATTVLALAGRLESQLTAAILSGTIGYVLGNTSRREGSSSPARSDGSERRPETQ